MNKTFLIEIGTEELPQKSLQNIAKSFRNNVILLLTKNHIQYKKILWFATPRRIAIKIEELNTNIITLKKKYKGPSISNAFDALGNPTPSTQHWIKKLGITIDKTSRIKNKKKEWLYYEHYTNNRTIEEKLIEISIFSIKNSSVPNFMKWNISNIQFSRPIRNVVMLLDNKIIKAEILGIQTNRLLYGHRFMKNNVINISHANEYPEILLKFGKIIADYNIRKNKIKIESKKIANSFGGHLKIRDQLLDEITSLVEWPIVLLAKFNKKFLDLPNEILIHIMENQQKYFTIYDHNNKLTNNFIIISNVESKYPKNIILGNIKVLNSRFSDAEFFFKKDQKIPFKKYQPLLKNVIFQHSLGSLYDKTNRIKYLISWITKFTKANLKDCIQAANLCKCDLITDIVFEFPKMQGIIGMYYALNNGIHKDIAIAIQEHYLPKFSQDIIPSHPISYSLALADKIDTLVGLFFIGKNSTSGDKDPFSLRRLVIGIIRIILTKKISINLFKLFKKSLNIYDNNIQNKNAILENLKKFVLEKMYFIYIKQKYVPIIIKSVLICEVPYLIDLDLRIKAISKIYNSNTLKSLILIHKRISNILKLSSEALHEEINKKLIKKLEEKIIISLLEHTQKKIQLFHENKDYPSILLELYNLYQPVCNFFENVKIQDINTSIKTNRLIILKKIQNLFFIIADFSYFY
ncbi:MAG: glycine--tRNA ligase subunit beta [Buchnera aphidicola (Floraphis choui)]